MDYLSAKELAQRWNVSTSRITYLANRGRIPGAKLVGRSWVFPPDTQRLPDGRCRESKNTERERAFRFPLYIYHAYTAEEIAEDFTDEERALLAGEQLLFTGRHQECFAAMEALLKACDDRYVRVGALYCLCISGIFLRQYRKAYLYYCEANLIFGEETRYKRELDFIRHNLETYFHGNRYYIDEFERTPLTDYPPHMRAFFILESAYADMLKALINGAAVNPVPYELLCMEPGERRSPLTRVMLRLYIGVICSSQGLTEKSLFYISQGCRIAQEHGFEPYIAFLYHYLPNLFSAALEDTAPDQLARLRSESRVFNDALTGMFEFAGKDTVLKDLDEKNMILLRMSKQGMTNKEIAAALGLSMSTISKRFAVIYEKTGIHSKNELLRLINDTIREF